MLLMLAAAIASEPPPAPAARAVKASVQATATIRIISGAELHFDRDQSADGFVMHASTIRSTGVEQPAKLIEFQ